MMGLNPLELPYLLVPYNEMEQGVLGTQGQPHCRCGGRCQACVAWERRVMRVQREAHLPLDEARDQHTDNRPHGPGRNPFRLREPHGSDRRGILPPTPSRLYSGIGVLLGLEKVGSATHRSGHGRGPPPPSLGLFWVGERLPPAGAGHAWRAARAEPVAGGGGRRRPESVPQATATGVDGDRDSPARSVHPPPGP